MPVLPIIAALHDLFPEASVLYSRPHGKYRLIIEDYQQKILKEDSPGKDIQDKRRSHRRLCRVEQGGGRRIP